MQMVLFYRLQLHCQDSIPLVPIIICLVKVIANLSKHQNGKNRSLCFDIEDKLHARPEHYSNRENRARLVVFNCEIIRHLHKDEMLSCNTIHVYVHVRYRCAVWSFCYQYNLTQQFLCYVVVLIIQRGLHLKKLWCYVT